jgi:glycerol-3-phosphate dehydrogenase subunit C
VPAIANGDAELARLLGRANTLRLAGHVDRGMSIVTACSSCGHALKTGFNGLLEGDKELAAAVRKVTSNSFDLGEFLMMQSDRGQLNIGFQQTDLRLAYHAPCHQKSQGMGRPWYHLLQQIPGVVVEDLNAGCCGMSGTYGFKQEKYEVSMAIAEDLFKSIEAAHPQAAVTECATCQMQIEHGAKVKAIHPVEILLQAYGA